MTFLQPLKREPLVTPPSADFRKHAKASPTRDTTQARGGREVRGTRLHKKNKNKKLGSTHTHIYTKYFVSTLRLVIYIALAMVCKNVTSLCLSRFLTQCIFVLRE